MLKIEVEREDDGRWIAEIADLPGVLAYGQSREEAIERAKALSLRVMAESIGAWRKRARDGGRVCG